jgi:DNA circularisation protein N-terminus
MPADVLSQLLETSFRSISFPSLTVSVKGGHGLVPHKRVDRNGWRVENVGMNSRAFSMKVPFINTIAPGPTETWGQTGAPLFPDTHDRVMVALADRSTGPFQHPIYGACTVKVEAWEETLDPDFRGGPTLVISLLETFDDPSSSAVAQPSPVSIATDAAVSLDAILLPLTPPPSTGTPGGISLTSFIKSIAAIGDQAQLFEMQVEGQIDHVIYAVQGLEASFGYQPGFSDATQRLISALHALKTQQLAADKPLSYYVTPKASTLAAIANRVGATVADLLTLNPTLVSGVSPIVPADTAVAYYG